VTWDAPNHAWHKALAEWFLVQIAVDEHLAQEGDEGRRMFAAQIKDMEPAVFDPDRVRDECAAKRRIAEDYLTEIRIGIERRPPMSLSWHGGRLSALCIVVMRLAEPYAKTRPGYRPEWVPGYRHEEWTELRP
jgi:hypothetical protein